MPVQYVGQSWKDLRKNQSSKWVNYTFIEKFESALKSIEINDLLNIQYCMSRPFGIKPDVIEYTESTPFVKLIKLSPQGYFINCYDSAPLWEKCDIDSSIIQTIGVTNKYEQSSNVYHFDKPYILFALQSLNFTSEKYLDVKTFAKVMYWAEINKIHVLFKLHPYNLQKDLTIKYWNALRKEGLGKQYVELVPAEYSIDHLIFNSIGVWTHSSGVAFQSLLYNKPTATISKNVDWWPISIVNDNPITTQFIEPNRDEVLRYLTWYYHKLTIDSTSVNLKNIIESRLHSFIEHNFDPERIYA